MLGCGAGVDTILVAIIVGPKGLVVGVNIVPKMIARAESNVQMMDLDNVTFQKTSGENLPFADDAFDVVISNEVVNLIPDKETAISEIIKGGKTCRTFDDGRSDCGGKHSKRYEGSLCKLVAMRGGHESSISANLRSIDILDILNASK